MAKGSMKSKTEELRRALKGLVKPHQQMIIDSMLNHISALNAQIESLSNEIDKRMIAEKELIEALDEIGGVGKDSAQVIISEIGTDMSQFSSAKHLSAWAGLSPGNNESAGKKKEVKLGRAIRLSEKHWRNAVVPPQTPRIRISTQCTGE
jgi:transposase